MKKITIALDGYSSCGKSTMAKELAKEIGYVYIDTGAMYRAVTLYAMRKGYILADGTIKAEDLEKDMASISIMFILNPEKKRPETVLNGEVVEDEIRTLEVSSHVSQIATLGFVRTAMVDLQRLMGEAKGVILDGRDIGTVVFPDAELKIFLTASPEVRAQRRFDELTAKGENVSYEDILNNVQERDRIDTTREISPLRKAEDAIILDNSHMTKGEQHAWLMGAFAVASR